MGKKYLTILSIFIATAIVGYFLVPTINEVNTDPKESKLVTPISEFPNNGDENYISNIASTQANSNFSYLLEHRGAFILKYDTEVNFVQKIGRPGRGPGELINPLDFAIDNDRIYTLEQGKMQIQEFDENGNYTDTYFFHGAYMGLLKLKDGFLLKNYYYDGMPEYSDMPDFGNYPLFTYFDPTLDSTFSFGKYPAFFEQLDINHSGSFSDVHDGFVYTGFRGFPYVQVLDSKGNIENEIYLKGDGLEKILEMYLYNPSESYPSLFLDMKVNEHGIFMSSYGEELELFHFNFDGDLKNKYTIKKDDPNDRYIKTFDIINSGSRNQLTLFATVHGLNIRTLIAQIDI